MYEIKIRGLAADNEIKQWHKPCFPRQGLYLALYHMKTCCLRNLPHTNQI